MDEIGPYRRLAFNTVVSTNDEALARLKDGDPGGLFVTARTQTGGRGRQGRVWTSPPGNLYASLALVDPAPPSIVSQLGFVAGVALATSLRDLLGGDRRLSIKWPNDILYDGAKMAGMLLEGTTLPSGRFGCVIGIGVNCLSHPDGLPYRATDLCEAGYEIEPDRVLVELAVSMDKHLIIWDQGRNFAAIREAWLRLAAGLGERIAVVTARGSEQGIFRGLDAVGRLRLETDAGEIVVDAGDVFMPGFAST